MQVPPPPPGSMPPLPPAPLPPASVPPAALGAVGGPPPALPKQRKWLPTLVVFFVILVVTLGGWVTAAALLEPSPAVQTDLFTLHPLEGWESQDIQADGVSGIRLSRGAGTLDVLGGTFRDGDERDLLDQYVREFLEPEASQLEVSIEEETVRLPSGELSVWATYAGIFGDQATPIEGEVVAVVTDEQVGVIFDGWAAQGQYGFVRDDVRTMIDTAELG